MPISELIPRVATCLGSHPLKLRFITTNSLPWSA